jgi:hypothetical protein
MKWIGTPRYLPIAGSAGVLLLAFASATEANAQPSDRRTGPEKGYFDDTFDLNLGFGALNHPYSGSRDIDYSDSFDPGYQWGLGLGWFERTDSGFGIGVGGFFEHALINAERQLDTGSSEHILRFGLELRPGFVVAERVFFNVALRGAYSADIAEVSDDSVEVAHGPMFGVAGGLDVGIFRRAYIGTAVGTDLHFFRGGEDVNAYLFTWRTYLGWRF